MSFKARIHRIPALILVVLLGVLVWRAWANVGDEPLTVDRHNDGFESISWAGTVRADGRLAVAVHYEFDDDTTRPFRAYLPHGARLVMLDGAPVSTSNGIVDETEVRGDATLSYELPDAITRYRDGAVLRLLEVSSTSLTGAEGLFSCPRCYIGETGYGDTPVFGALFVEDADAVRFHVVGVSPLRHRAVGAGEAGFAGIDRGTGDVSMVAELSADAVPQLVTRDGTVARAMEAIRDEVEPTGERLREPGRGPHGERWAAIAISAMVGLVVVGLVLQLLVPRLRAAFGRAARDAAADPLAGHLPFADTRSVRPTDLEPALAGFIVGDAVAGDRSSVGATIVEMCRKGIVDLVGADTRRFRIVVPSNAAGTTPFEQAVLASLRLDVPAGESVERTTPNLWGAKAPMARAALTRALLRAARRAGLLRVNLTARLLLPLTIASAIVAIIASNIDAYPWVVLFLGSVLAVAASFSAAMSLTARGATERDHWIEYAAYLRSNQHLAAAAPWTVSNYGQVLSYAVALGAAPEAARALSPDRGKDA